MSSSNEYMRQYMRKYSAKRKQMVHDVLGGKCTICGSIKNLQVDHSDRKNKSLTLGKRWHQKWAITLREIKKCQLLCHDCHNKKTLKELGFREGKGNHGSLASYRYCHCELCKQAHREWFKKYYQNHKRITINGKEVVIKIGAVAELV